MVPTRFVTRKVPAQRYGFWPNTAGLFRSKVEQSFAAKRAMRLGELSAQDTMLLDGYADPFESEKRVRCHVTTFVVTAPATFVSQSAQVAIVAGVARGMAQHSRLIR